MATDKSITVNIIGAGVIALLSIGWAVNGVQLQHSAEILRAQVSDRDDEIKRLYASDRIGLRICMDERSRKAREAASRPGKN